MADAESALPVPVTVSGGGRSTLSQPDELLAAQLRGLQRWQAAQRTTEQSAQRRGLTREQRLDAARHLHVRRREQQPLLGRIEHSGQQLQPMPARLPITAVIAHSHTWTSERLRAELEDRAVEVVGVLTNGADAVGMSVVEQPALVVVDELLAMLSGSDVTAALGRFCPNTVVVGYATNSAAAAALLKAGVTSVLTRKVPPADAAQAFTTPIQR